MYGGSIERGTVDLKTGEHEFKSLHSNKLRTAEENDIAVEVTSKEVKAASPLLNSNFSQSGPWHLPAMTAKKSLLKSMPLLKIPPNW